MAKQGSGIIVNVGSVAGIASVPWMGLCKLKPSLADEQADFLWQMAQQKRLSAR